MQESRNSIANALIKIGPFRAGAHAGSVMDKFGFCGHNAGILCMHPANERRRYNVTSSLICWAHTESDPW